MNNVVVDWEERALIAESKVRELELRLYYQQELIRSLKDKADKYLKFYNTSMDSIHEAAGIERNGLVGILSWIENVNDLINNQKSEKP